MGSKPALLSFKLDLQTRMDGYLSLKCVALNGSKTYYFLTLTIFSNFTAT